MVLSSKGGEILLGSTSMNVYQVAFLFFVFIFTDRLVRLLSWLAYPDGRLTVDRHAGRLAASDLFFFS